VLLQCSGFDNISRRRGVQARNTVHDGSRLSSEVQVK